MARKKKVRRDLTDTERKWFDEEFWPEYPRKVNPVHAREAYAERPQWTREKFDRMLDSLRRQKRSRQWLKENGQFIPYPASWLRAGGEDNELEPMFPEPPKVCSQCGKSKTVHNLVKQYGREQISRQFKIEQVCESYRE